MRVSREFIRALVARADIADIVGARVRLQRRGANWFGLCPFHGEKTPSFSVNPERGFYHCFGCGAHGTALDFVVKTECAGDFMAGVEALARRLGMELPRDGGAKVAQADKLEQEMAGLLQAALGRWRRLLAETPQAQEYLRGRGMSGETAARFSLGYAADEWRGLEGFLPDYHGAAVVRAGLAREKDGRRYDYFRGRIMFPIFSAPNRLAGFGGRALGDEEPKYLNSPDSPLFAKGRTLFGLPQAGEFARRRNRLIVCEGYMDAVMLSQAGFGEAAATMGTAATAAQMEKAARAADNVIFAFDGDAAGRAAAWRALGGILPALRDGKSVSFLFLPAGEDPDSFIQKKGAAAFESLLGGAMSLGDYAAARLLEDAGAETDEGRRSAAGLGALQLLAKVRTERAPFLRGILHRKFEEAIGVRLDARMLKQAAQRAADLERTGGMRPARRMDARARRGLRMRPEGLLFKLLCCLQARPELGLTLLEESPPLPGAAGEMEAVEVVLARLRNAAAEDDAQAAGEDDRPAAPDGEDEQTAASGDGKMDAAEWLAAEGFAAAAAQVRTGGRRFATAAGTAAEQEFHGILRALERRHLKKTGAGKNDWLAKMRAAPAPSSPTTTTTAGEAAPGTEEENEAAEDEAAEDDYDIPPLTDGNWVAPGGG